MPIPFGPREPDPDRMLLIVAGVHLRAEIGDRPICYALCDRIEEWLRDVAGEDPADWPFEPIVCSDVWRINTESLSRAPVISVGGPDVNALTAYFADKLDSVFVVDDHLIVQLDLDHDDLAAACWGVNARATAEAADAFVERYLRDFLDAARRRLAPPATR